MEDTGVAIELDKSVWIDKARHKSNEQNVHMRKVTHKLIRPVVCIYGDEVGDNLSM